MLRSLPIVLSIGLNARFLASDESDALEVVLKQGDAPGDWDLPWVPDEATLLGQCRHYKSQLADNIREGAARPSLGIALNNLATIHLYSGRGADCTGALYEADQWFAEIPVYHPPPGKYDLVGRAVVAYNAGVLGQYEDDLASVRRQCDMATMFLDAVPDIEQDQGYEFVRWAVEVMAHHAR